jgi:hypothetical protein
VQLICSKKALSMQNTYSTAQEQASCTVADAREGAVAASVDCELDVLHKSSSAGVDATVCQGDVIAGWC